LTATCAMMHWRRGKRQFQPPAIGGGLNVNTFEVPQPILNSPFAEPAHHWCIREGGEPQMNAGRRPAIAYPPRDEPRG
jgi:hypothetical protein